MKSMALGVLVGGGLIWTLSGVAREPMAAAQPRQIDAGYASSPELLAMAAAAGDDRQQVTVIDPRTRVMGVYSIDHKSGEITLRSVRNITWDLQLIEFNATSPTPRELKSQRER
jgi:hypothetical protein